MYSWICVKERLDGMMTVDGSPIPQQHDRSAQVPEQILEEDFDICVFEATRAELHVQSNVSSMWRDADGSKGGDSVLLEPVVEVRCLAPWCPGAPHVGNEQKPAFIHEYEMGAKSCGFFLCEASRSLSTVQLHLRPVGARDVRVFDNSIRVVPRAATSDSDDIECETAS
jgi:hypothetical protein